MLGWPFDSTVTEDTEGNPVYSRAYSADVLATFLTTFFQNGVFVRDEDALQVLEGTGMTVEINPGKCHINGRLGSEETTRVLSVSAANASLDRIDTVVVRLNLAVDALTIDLYVVTGTAAATPTAPALTRNSSVYEIGLANVLVVHNTTSIPQSRITDTRLDSSRCGAVITLLDEVDLSTFYTQFQASLDAFVSDREDAFDTWLAAIQAELTESVVGGLIAMIEASRGRVVTVTIGEQDWVYVDDDTFTYTASVADIPADCVVTIRPQDASRVHFEYLMVRCSAVTTSSITFTRSARKFKSEFGSTTLYIDALIQEV